MIRIYLQGDERPPGGIPRSVGNFFPIHFYPYRRGSSALQVVEDALSLISDRIAADGVLENCNLAFSRIRGVSFSDLFTGDEVTVTIFRSPGAQPQNGSLGLTAGQGLARHLTLTARCWGLSPSQVGNAAARTTLVRRCAATIVHELAHCAGAPGRPSTAAERTLIPCGFRDMFNPDFVG